MSDQNDKTPDEIMRELAEKKSQETKLSAKSETPAEMTTATLEKTLKSEKEQALSEKNNEKKRADFQPEVTQLKKENKDRFLKGMIALILAVIVLGFVGMNIFRAYIDEEEKPQSRDNEVSTGSHGRNIRKDLGQHDPFQTDTVSQNSGEDKSLHENDDDVSLPPPPKTAVFSRALALVGVSSSEAQRSTPTRSRAEERRLKNSDMPAEKVSATQAVGTFPQRVNAVKRIPYDPDLYVPENRAIACALTRRFVSDVAGKLECVLTEDIYSASGHTRLIDRGTVAHLDYNTGTLTHGQGRAFLIVNKLRTRQPPYLDIPLGGENGVAGELGESGVSGWIDDHYFKRFSGALMVGMIPDVMAGISNNAVNKDRNTDYTQNSREAFAEMAKETLKNSINIPPTLYKNQGEIITLITHQDIDFSSIYQLKMKR